MNEEFEELVDMIGLEQDGILFREDFHPAEIAMDMVNFKALELISKHIQKNNSLLVTKTHLLKALDSPSSIFMRAMVEAFFNPPGLDRSALPNSLSIDSAEFPYFYKSSSQNLEQEDIDKINMREDSTSSEKQIYEYYRISRMVSLHLSSKFIR